MNSPDLLLLVENCPKGAETLVTRCLHILTDKGTTVFEFGCLCLFVCLFMCMLAAVHVLCLFILCPFAVPPSPDLVERVRDLYHKRVPDVRFLIPVINGLEKVSRLPFKMLTPSSILKGSQCYLKTVVLLLGVDLIALLLYLTERGDPGIAQTHQAQPHSSQGGLQSPTGDATQ